MATISPAAVITIIPIIPFPLIMVRMALDLIVFSFMAVSDNHLAMIIPVAAILCFIGIIVPVRIRIIIDHHLVTAIQIIMPVLVRK